MKPNIIYVLADQLRLQSCGYAGDALARTPCIDRLAEESVSFGSMVSSMPVCSAYRASLFTGKHATTTGMVINELRLDPGHRCLAHCLSDAAYETGYIGKWHLWANQLGNHLDPENSFVPPGSHRMGFDGFWAAYNFHHDYYGEPAYYHTDSPGKIHFPADVYEPDGQTDLAIDFVRAHAGGDAPFALVLSVGTPHDPWVAGNVPEHWHDLFRDVDMPLCETYADTNQDPYGDAWSDIPKTRDSVRKWKRVYSAMVANLDWNVGRLQQTVREAGIEENTIFIFTSDHGEMFGAHGRMKKNIFYEEAVRVPFLLKWPTVAPAGRRTDVCATNVDIMPTLLGLLGLEIPSEVEGMDLSHCVVSDAGLEPEAAFLQNTGACAAWEDGHEWRALRGCRYTYALFRVDGAEYLFDHQRDPEQQHNLIADPSHANTLARLRRLLAERMAAIGDTFPASTWYRDHRVSPDRIILPLPPTL